MEAEFDSSTEYKASYTWKNRPQEDANDKYEEAVERMMQAQFLNFSPNSNKSKQELDPYEMIVRKKMNENPPDEYAYQQQAQNQKIDSGSMKSSGSSHSHHHHHHQQNPQQRQQQLYQERPNNLGSGANSVSSRSSSRSSRRSKHSDAGSFQDINDNISVGSSQDTEIKFVNKAQKGDKSKKKRKEYDASHLNKSKRSMLTEEFSDLRPIFFRDPDHATEEEKKYLYGPFYVSWPKNKAMPPQFAELQKVYHNTHYY